MLNLHLGHRYFTLECLPLGYFALAPMISYLSSDLYVPSLAYIRMGSNDIDEWSY